jgi:UDP-N-acetyl-D-glucosamine dehydrogenase
VQNERSTAREEDPAADQRADEPAPAGFVAVVGLGYVGLPTALGFRDTGRGVIGLDVSLERLAAVRSGDVDLLPADRWRLRGALRDERFMLTADPAALASAEAVVVCVPTSVDGHFTPDLRALRAACATVVAHARRGQTIVLTSTSFVGTTRELIADPLAELGFTVGTDVFVAFSPERIDPGRPDHLPAHTPRVVGGITEACLRRAMAVLAGLTDAGLHPVGSVDAAELVKLHENSFRAVNLALANETADVCRALGLDPVEVIEAAATKPYGYLAHLPGPGVGGECIPCDPHYLLWQMRERRVPVPLIEQAMAAIAGRPAKVVARVIETLAEIGCPLRTARVMVVGVAYKPGVADLRQSSAIEIVTGLLARGVDVAYWDPLVPVLPLTQDRALVGEPDPRGEDYDLILVHTLHPDTSHDWVRTCPAVLDATYRYAGAAHREVL